MEMDEYRLKEIDIAMLAFYSVLIFMRVIFDIQFIYKMNTRMEHIKRVEISVV